MWSAPPPASAPGRTQRDDGVDQHQQRRDRCALHFSQTAASKKITDDIVKAVELALSKAYGADIPAHLALELKFMQHASDQCSLAHEWLASYGHPPFDDSQPRPQPTVSDADLAYARQSAQRATKLALDCSRRLVALAHITDASGTVAANFPLQHDADNFIDARKINSTLDIIASDAFQARLTNSLTIEQRLQRGMHQAGTVLQHVASGAVEWLIPTLKTEDPAVYAQHIAALIPKARTAATIDWVAQPRFNATQRCLGRVLLHAPRSTDDSTRAESAALKQRIYHLRDRSNALYQQTNEAAKTTSGLVLSGAPAWRNVSHAERDMAVATAAQDRALAALPQLEALLEEAKELPGALSPAALQAR